MQAGGDLFARGKLDVPTGKPASAIRAAPRASGSRSCRSPYHAFSTAGDYERSYIVGGKRFHHIIDPRTGYPATACRSVTIWAPSALVADEIDDAVFILGPKKGLELVESLDGVGAVIVDAEQRLGQQAAPGKARSGRRAERRALTYTRALHFLQGPDPRW